MRQRVIVLTLSTLAVLTVAQAAAPNFTGDWKLNTAKSDYGPVPAPEVMTRNIKHNDPSIQIKTYQKGAQGEVNTEIKYTTDGKESMNKIQGADSKGTAKWDGDKLVIDSTRDAQGMELKFHETWSLSDGGKVMTIMNHITAPQGEFDISLVFEKQ